MKIFEALDPVVDPDDPEEDVTVDEVTTEATVAVVDVVLEPEVELEGVEIGHQIRLGTNPIETRVFTCLQVSLLIDTPRKRSSRRGLLVSESVYGTISRFIYFQLNYALMYGSHQRTME